jgi:hypothetical protein
VDSVNGSDANDGLTAETPLQSLAAAESATVSGSIVGLARGSYWREQFDIPANNVSIAAYGSGAMPIMDGADVAGTWTQPDAITYPNVWSQSWSRTSATTTSSEMLGYWEAGARPRYATNATTDLQANGGWFTTNLTAQTSTVSIKSLTNPNVDGVVREITKRHYGINGHNSTLGVTLTGQSVIGPIEIKRCVGHYNAYSGGTGQAKRMLLRDGNIHHSVTEGSLLEDMLGTEYSPAIAPSVFVAYKGSGAGFSSTFRRLMALFPGGASRVTGSASAFYAHSATTQEPASLTIEGCATRGIDFANASAQLMTVTGSYCEDPHQIVVGEAAVLNIVTALMVRDTAATPLAAGNQLFRRLLTSSTFQGSHIASNTRKGACVRNVTGGTPPVLSHCAICNTTNGDGLSGGEFDSIYNVLYVNGRVMELVTNLYTGDFNVYHFIGQTNPTLRWNNILYSGTDSLKNFVAASGQDTNSVYLQSADQTSGNANAFWLGISTAANNGPADGDYRINPSARVYDRDNTARIGLFGDGVTPITLAGPQQHWDFNLRALVAGPPSRYPVLPATIAEMRTYIEDPAAWDFYP